MIQEPVPMLFERVMLRVAKDRAVAEGRRQLPPVLHVGIPGGGARTYRVDPNDQLDLALRVEMVEAMCRDAVAANTVPLVWLTRQVDGPDTEDLAWGAAVGCAGPELGIDLDLVVVTRRSWRDPRTGVGRTWTRLRPGKA